MLIEVKTKVEFIIDNKSKKKAVTYVLDTEFFANAEYQVTGMLEELKKQSTVKSYDVLSLKQSPIKEVITNHDGEHSYIATLEDIFTEDDGTEKKLKYKVLLWADNHQQALAHITELVKQGYDLAIKGIKEVDYEYLNENVD
jgi:hypothetical protein